MMKIELGICEFVPRREAGEDKVIASGSIIKNNGEEVFFYLEVGEIQCKLSIEKRDPEILRIFMKSLGKPVTLKNEAGFPTMIWYLNNRIIKKLEKIFDIKIV